MFLQYGDLRDTMSIRDVVVKAKPDYVFHLAAQSFPRTSFDAPLDTMDTNIQGTVRVLDALREHAPKAVIHVCASSEVFGRVPRRSCRSTRNARSTRPRPTPSPRSAPTWWAASMPRPMA